MSKWISVKDMVPETGVEVLIRIPVCGYFNVENGSYRGEGKWYGAWCSSRGEGYAYKVTHWAEMPEAPQ